MFVSYQTECIDIEASTNKVWVITSINYAYKPYYYVTIFSSLSKLCVSQALHIAGNAAHLGCQNY